MSGWWGIPHLRNFNIKLWSNSTNGTESQTNERTNKQMNEQTYEWTNRQKESRKLYTPQHKKHSVHFLGLLLQFFRCLNFWIFTVDGTDLTHICLVDFSIHINWTSPFLILGVSGVLFHFYSIPKDIPVSKQWRPWLDATFCVVWSDLGLNCLPRSQKWDARLIWVKWLA